jgi:cytochrome c
MAGPFQHVRQQGQKLRGQRFSQVQSDGFPEYRLGEGRISSFHQRLGECFVSFRAEPFEAGSQEYDLLGPLCCLARQRPADRNARSALLIRSWQI